MKLYDAVPDQIREKIYNVLEECIFRGVSFNDFQRVVRQAWPELHWEKARIAEKDVIDKTPYL
jgi:hypothetical protein